MRLGEVGMWKPGNYYSCVYHVQMRRIMILGSHISVTCVRNARCWGITAEESGIDKVG